MDKIACLKAFVAVAERQSFSAAARHLDLSAPAVTRAIAVLEQELGIVLFQRTTRIVRLTEAGERYLEDAKPILTSLAAADEAVAGVSAVPRGKLAITAPVLFGQKYVMPGIVAFLQEYPQTEVDAVFLDRVVNLVEEGFDAGIRIGALPDSSMRARRVASVKWQLLASPDYLQRCGTPDHPRQLTEGHAMIEVRAGTTGRDWQLRERDQALTVKPVSRLRVNSNDGAISAALAGFGIARLMSYQVQDALQEGSLVSVLDDFAAPEIPVHIVHREGRLSARKVRAFIDFMAQFLQDIPHLQADA